MIRQYYTLEKIAAELQCLLGCELKECFSQEKDTVIFIFASGNEIKYLQYSSDNKLNSIFLRNQYIRAKKNSVNLFPHIIGETLQEINLIPGERILNFKLIHTDIYFTLFGGSNSNLYLVGSENLIIDTLNHPKRFVGELFKLPSKTSLSLSDFPHNTKIIKAISNACSYAGNYYAEEICYRIGKSPDLLIGELSKNDLIDIENQVLALRRQCMNSQYIYILQNDSGEKLLSLIPLKKYPFIIDKFSSVSRAIEKRVIDMIVYQKYEELKKVILKKLFTYKSKLQKSIADIKYNDTMLENARKYKHWAEILISQPEPKAKPGHTITLKDWEEKDIIIPLNSKWTLAENAAYFFEKAKDIKKNIEVREKQITGLFKKLEKLELIEQNLDTKKNIDELEKLKLDLSLLTGEKSNHSTNLSDKFRKFYLGNGFELYVGKNASNNEELTFKFAKPHDLWLHARGAGGSHCVLPLGKEQKPPEKILQRAASIAAYYSQARGSKFAPVAYTYKKYVRKPKGSNIGTVIISREEVIMAEPSLPKEDVEL